MKMIASMFVCVAMAAAAAADDAAPIRENAIFKELTETGLKMPEGTMVKLPPPILADGLDAAAQQEAIMKFNVPLDCTWDDFVADDSHAPVRTKIITLKKGKPGYALRVMNAGFVARGKWDVLVSKKFSDTLTEKKGEKANAKGGGGMLRRSGFLTKEEAAKRGLKIVSGKEGGDSWFYTTFALMDMVEVSATRYALLTKTADGIILAGRIDPKFDTDPDYPNVWQAIAKDALGNPVLGPKHPYSGSGFYLKATRLKAPKNAIYFEFHSAYNEPAGWFDGGTDLKGKLGSIIKFRAEDFRGKFGRASQ